ncbi:hypothetical protein MB901379_04450 [Mycobacterium basiliense]|uniref:Uncharacterized protein n=1 Tax=Mycobacterium basiliense TaxID=2094119 RepID=A0A3S4FU85_9MYCO|nr:hypothetical protein [Mycobacterium basiliense]VDM90841.1 hypothetical protein MB901379_04450 [Mycobacterium basiliense]
MDTSDLWMVAAAAAIALAVVAALIVVLDVTLKRRETLAEEAGARARAARDAAKTCRPHGPKGRVRSARVGFVASSQDRTLGFR